MSNATPCTQPLASNDTGRTRPIYFTTKQGAESHARRQARADSPTATITGVPFVRNLFRAVEGGRAWEVKMAQFGDFEVREVTEHEIVRRQQAGMRADVVRLLEQAVEYEAKAAATKPGFESLRQQRLRYAREARDEARQIELQLTISGVRPTAALVSDIEPLFSGERDAREAGSL
jgi:hypothetical protein